MSSERWCCWCLSATLVLLCAVAGLNRCVDPTGRWGAVLFPVRSYVGPRIAIAKIRGFERSDATIVFLGSSREQFIDTPDFLDGQLVYNLAYPDAGIRGIADLADLAIDSGRVRRLFVGLDFRGFPHPGTMDPTPIAQVQLGGAAQLTEDLVSWQSTQESLRLLNWAGGEDRTYLHFIDFRNGQTAYFGAVSSAESRQRAWEEYRTRSQLMVSLIEQGAMSVAFDQLDRIIEQARRADVALVLFINPISAELADFYREVGLWPEVQNWRLECARRYPTIDLLDDPEILGKARFYDFSHLDPRDSSMVLDRLR